MASSTASPYLGDLRKDQTVVSWMENELLRETQFRNMWGKQLVHVLVIRTLYYNNLKH